MICRLNEIKIDKTKKEKSEDPIDPMVDFPIEISVLMGITIIYVILVIFSHW